MKRCLGLALTIACCLLAVPSQFCEAAEVAQGALTDVKGSVEVLKRGTKDWVEVDHAYMIAPGDVVQTGINGKATLNFKNSVTKIDPLTQFVLGRSVEQDTEMYTELYLLSGKISSHVKKTKLSGIKNKFNVVTPTAVVGVRGTIQTVEYNPGMGTHADIKDGKGFAAPVPVENLPPAVLELLGLKPAGKPSKDTSAGPLKSSEKKKE